MWRLAIHLTGYSLSSEYLADWSLQSFVLLTFRFWEKDNNRENGEGKISSLNHSNCPTGQLKQTVPVQLLYCEHCWKLLCHHLSQTAVQHQTLSCCTPAVRSVITYLRYLCKLSVCLAALVCRLHSNLIVVHKGPVHSELAGLQGTGRVQITPIL